jgi:GTP-binding protein Era
VSETPAGFRAGFVSIIGRTNVGKSTLVNRLVGCKMAIVSEKPQTTRNRILAVVNRDCGQMVVFDTPGIHRPDHRMNERMVQLAVRSLDLVDVVLWLVDVNETFGPGDRRIAQLLRRAGRPALLGINKIDSAPKSLILPRIDAYRTELDFREIIPISALTGENVALLADRLAALLPEGPPLYPDDFLTDKPERFFVSELVREQILAQTQRELPYTTAVIVESFKEEQKFVRIHATILAERPGQKGILIGKSGARLKAIGTAARREIEGFLGTKVVLHLFVKVRERWRENITLLDDMGLTEIAGSDAASKAD